MGAFTSTTTSLEITQRFLEETGGTLFVVSGSPWGYDISVFSDFPEEKDGSKRTESDYGKYHDGYHV